MLRSKCMVMSLLILMAISNLVDAANQTYIVSFVAGRPGLGLVKVTPTDTGIQARPASITPMGTTMGSTAVGRLDFSHDITVIATYARAGSKPIEIGFFKFDDQLKMTTGGGLGLFPGQYHPLHLYASGLLATGSFGTPGANDYVGYYFFETELIDMRNIFVNPANRSPGTAAAAPDGGLMSQMTFTGLNHVGLDQKLKNNGDLAGPPSQWLNVNDFQGYSQSLSNPVDSPNRGTAAPKANTRYLAYRNFRQPGTANSQSQVVIQNVGAVTGQLQGPPRAITNFAKALNVDAEKFQSIAISPDGRLILYSAWNGDCKKQVLVARSLTNGSVVGKPKVVVGCKQLEEYPVGVYGINIDPIFQ